MTDDTRRTRKTKTHPHAAIVPDEENPRYGTLMGWYTTAERAAEVVAQFQEAEKVDIEELLNPPPPQPELTREYLIDLCERSVVNVERWSNRDTPRSQEKVGLAWALLKAGCSWNVASSPQSDVNTIWIEIHYPTFNSFEYDRTDPEYFEELTVYLPTEKRLKQNEGRDWY